MNAADWEKLSKNWEEIIGISQPDEIYLNLYQKDVITQREKETLDACKTKIKQMEELLKLLKRKPSEAFRKFLDIIRENSPWLAAKIENTPTVSDERVRDPGDPHLLDDSVRTALRKYFANKEGVSTPLPEIRDVLKKERIFTGANEWSNKDLQDFIQDEFVGVKSEQKQKREGKKSRKFVYMTNLGKIDPAQVKDQRQPLAAGSSKSPQAQAVKLSDMSPEQLKEHLLPQFEAKKLPTDILDIMEREAISGDIFLTLQEQDFEKLCPSSIFGVRRFLSMLIKENQPVTEAPPYIEHPRPFDSPVSHIHKYYKGRCMDASVNVRGKMTERVKNFHLCPDANKDLSLQFISSELIPFVSACLNERRNGTIYFGISPSDSDEYKAGEVVGLNLPQEEVNAEINESLKDSYQDKQCNIIQATVRDAKFIPVISLRSLADSQLWVIEVDVKPSDSVLKDDKVRTRMRNLPLHAKKSKSRERAIFTFSDEGKPRVVSPGELDRYDEDQPRKVKQRQMEEEEARRRRVPAPNLRNKLLNLLTGGKETLDDTIFPLILTSPIDSHMDMEYLSNNMTFIKSLKAEIVFDFDPKGSSDGIYKNMDTKQNELMRVLITDNFDKDTYKNMEEHEEFIKDFKSQNRTQWMFCNGYAQLGIKPLVDPLKWNRERKQAFENCLRFSLDNFNTERIIVIICLFSKNYEIVIEACDEVLKMLPNNWILLAESEDIARLWQDQVVSRNIVAKDELIDRCVVGMPWHQVNETIRQIVRSDEIYGCLVPSSTGALIEINEKKIKQWSDIDILHSDDFSESENNEREMKKAEEQFYRGEKVTWLNFWYSDQVLSRDIHTNLTRMVEKALQGEGIEEGDKVTCVTLLHQPGAGGTTSAKHVLWDLRKYYRCCVVQTITDQTCDQLDQFRRYEDTTPKPLLVLIDNEDEENYLKLMGKLEENGRKLARNADSPENVYCTIIHCERRAALPLQIKRYQITLRHELTGSELAWFRRTDERLKVRFKNDQLSNLNPRFLISFNILKENFNPSYISNVVKEFSDSVKIPNELTLLKIVSFLNTFDPTFQWVSVSCLDKLFKTRESSSSKHQPGTLKRNQSWEATLSEGVRVLLNLSSKGGRSEGSKRFVRVINKNTAQEILQNMKDRAHQTESEIMKELIESGVFESEQDDMKQLGHLIKNIVKKRGFDETGTYKSKFSRFVLHVHKEEGEDVVVNLLEILLDLNQDAFIAQLLARFSYIVKKDWDQANKYADRAVKLVPTNSCLWDTYGQISKTQLSEKASPAGGEVSSEQIPELIQLCENSLKAFRKEQQLSEHGKTPGENNLAGYFGELDSFLGLLQTLSKCPVFSKDSGMLQRYLVDRQFYPQHLRFLNEDASKFLKELENSVQNCMRRLDEEYLQIKNNSTFTETSNTAYDNISTDQLLKLKVNLYYFFGESNDEVLANLSPSDRCDYNRRKAFHMGGDSLNRLLELRANSEKDKLHHIYKILKDNVTSAIPCKFDDTRSILDTLTVHLIDQNPPQDLKYDMVLEWCRQLYDMNREKPSKGSGIYLEPYLYFVLYNFPTEERLQYNLCSTRELMLAIENWKEDFRKKYPKCREEGTRRKETTVFFLGNGQPLKDIVHQHSLPNLRRYRLNEKWQVPEIREKLRLFSGGLCDGGDKINYRITPEEDDGLLISTSHPVKDKAMLQKQVYFYLGFSFSGPKAFGMSLEELGNGVPSR